ncbi:SusD/RagB family nutrient-binding outer membrane lipoprotein [Terrimonas alba]|uniref:SusD/RagB family nutrient-binding outer membrane lipoprotein n=1 Tax=Terrimonas alba TaxID=3349636 RepID=UPI0035F26181
MKKILIYLAVIFLMAAGCTKELTSLNVDPKNPSTSPSYAFFTNAQRAFANTMTSSNVNLNIFRLITQYWQETTYTDESNYDLATREINDAVWNALFRDALRDFQEAKNLIPSDVPDATLQKNQLAITEIMQIYAFYYLVTTYGNIPYSQALDIDNPFPVYDDAATAYSDLLTRLDAAVGNLDVAGESFGSADIIYGGDVALWKKFGNSLKLKMGMTIADVDAAKAKTVVESAVTSGVFTSNDDNAKFAYQGAPPNTNPIWVDLVQSGRQDFVAATTIVEEMKDRSDPRIPLYFTVDGSGVYSGLDPGVAGSYSAFSKPDEAIVAPDFPATLLDYAEVEFLLAEAIQRGFAVGGTAVTHYNNAITASILDWGGTEAQATAYLAQPTVIFNPANWKESIGVQKWIALYNRGFEAWIEWRRLDYPQLLPAADADPQVIPVRYPYPVNEQNVNTTNYKAAADAIGGDEKETKLWFDKF